MIVLGALFVVCALLYLTIFRKRKYPDVRRDVHRMVAWQGVILGVILVLWGLLDGRMTAVREVLSLVGVG
jgi:hypothetical protein